MAEKQSSRTSWVLLALFLMVGILIGIRLNRYMARRAGHLQMGGGKGKVETVLQAIKDNYVDTVNLDRLTDASLEAMLTQLDPHSVYIPAADFAKAEEEIEGNFEG
ncbi:MAG: hypothetical protein K2F84_02730, partial [Bacteroidales bacterium]|nr:hypothetical protein [Bacteroidales bacterium]